MLAISNKTDCCGCGACANICPQGCICMCADTEGFLYPNINKTACVECGLCEKVCPLRHKPLQHEIFEVYGVKNHTEDVRLTSSSGGVFTLLAEKVLAEGGAVWGAALAENLDVRHICTENMAELPKLRGSKYVQSVMEDCFIQVRAALRSDRQVLFSGTPCQIAGLKGFLMKDYANLLTVDLVCHGAPSPVVYRKYLQELGAEAGEPVVHVCFRDKSRGWKSGETLFFTERRRFGASKRRETYMRLFLNNVSIRPSCGQCAFNNKRSLADITIGDYWGVDKQYPEFDDDKGVTLAIVNTEKGRQLFDAVRERADVLPTTFEQGAEYNWAVEKSLPLHPQRQFFFENLERYTLREMAALLLEDD